MKNYPHGFAVTIPYLEENGDGTNSMKRVLLSTNSPCDRRRVKRTIRTWVRNELGRSISTYELRLIGKMIIKHKEPRYYVRHSAPHG